jgi:cytoskeleton protein RodZ
MNAENSDFIPAPAAPASAGESPGLSIRKAREAAGLSLDELAAQTKLARTTLDALERDDYGSLLEPVYVRGYYRKCAKVLNLPEQQLLLAYAARVTPKTPQPPAKLRLGTGADMGGGRSWRGLLGIIVIVAIAGTAIWYLREQQQSSQQSIVPLPESTAPEAAAPGSAPADASPQGSVNDSSTPATAGGVNVAPADAPITGSAATPSPAVPAPNAPAASPQAAVTGSEPATAAASDSASALKLNFVSISWARIEDANGKVLLNRVVQGGERQVLDGKPPYSVFLGNAPGVEAEFQGKPVDFKALIRDTATARFTVPLAR